MFFRQRPRPSSPGARRSSRIRSGLATLAVFGGSAAAAPGIPPGTPEDPRLLARSIYVPVVFEVAPCLRGVVVRTDEGRVRAVAPGRLVSQFTWYGGGRGLDPEWERLTVEGEIAGDAAAEPTGRTDNASHNASHNASRFRAEIVITPTSIYYGRRRLALDPDLSTGRARSRGRADHRVEETKLLLRPAGGCAPPGLAVPAADRP